MTVLGCNNLSWFRLLLRVLPSSFSLSNSFLSLGFLRLQFLQLLLHRLLTITISIELDATMLTRSPRRTYNRGCLAKPAMEGARQDTSRGMLEGTGRAGAAYTESACDCLRLGLGLVTRRMGECACTGGFGASRSEATWDCVCRM